MRINALTIAGTDPSGGAGIQADLKTFSALGVYGTTVMTALVAQNTCGVNSVHSVPPEFVAAQLDAVLTDVRIDSAKIGMLSDGGVIRTVAEKLRQYPVPYVVLDTVMLAKSGDPLLKAEAVDLLISELLPHVSIITPNLPEAAALLKTAVATDEKMMQQQGEALMAAGANAVLLKGGHLDNAESPDWLFLPEGRHRFTKTATAPAVHYLQQWRHCGLSVRTGRKPRRRQNSICTGRWRRQTASKWATDMVRFTIFISGGDIAR